MVKKEYPSFNFPRIPVLTFPVLTYYISLTINCNDICIYQMKGWEIDIVERHGQANLCYVIITQTRVFRHGCFMFFFIRHMISAQQKSFGVLRFNKTSLDDLQAELHQQ